MRNQRTYSAVLNNGIPITLCHRAVKLFRISVKPDGSVEAVAPWRMSRETALSLANERADWVREHRAKFLERGVVQYANGELVPLWGVKCPLRVISGKPGAQFDGEYIVLSAPEDSGAEARHAALLTLYRRELERAIPPLVSKYAAALDVATPRWSLRDMRSRWGRCTPALPEYLFRFPAHRTAALSLSSSVQYEKPEEQNFLSGSCCPLYGTQEFLRCILRSFSS